MARTLAGSAIASSSLPSSKPNGSTIVRRAQLRRERERPRSGRPGVAELDEAHADLRGERGDELGLGQHALVDEHPARAPGRARWCSSNAVAQLALGDQAAFEQDVAELLHAVPSMLIPLDESSAS